MRDIESGVANDAVDWNQLGRSQKMVQVRRLRTAAESPLPWSSRTSRSVVPRSAQCVFETGQHRHLRRRG
jgi:hypothetical protein